MKTLTIAFSACLLIYATTAAQSKSNNYSSLDEALVHPENVEWLTLRDQKLKEFPVQILSLPKLKYLDLSLNEISSIPEEIGSLGQLRFVDLSGNPINALPNGFSALTQLSNVYLAYNRRLNLSQGLDVLAKLPNLRVLDLSGNQIQHLPPTIGMLSELRYLELSHNPIAELPSEFSQMRNLHTLGLMGNEQFDIARHIAVLSRLPQLKTVHLTNQRLDGFGSSGGTMWQYPGGVMTDWPTADKNHRKTGNGWGLSPPQQGVALAPTLSPNITIYF